MYFETMTARGSSAKSIYTDGNISRLSQGVSSFTPFSIGKVRRDRSTNLRADRPDEIYLYAAASWSASPYQ